MTLRRPANFWLPELTLVAIGLHPITESHAHEIRPALLDITEREPGWFDVTWKVPALGDRVLALTPVLPASLKPLGPPSSHAVPGAQIQHFTYRSDGEPLAGQTISIDGLTTLQIDVLVQIKLADGSTHSAIPRPKSPSFEIAARGSRGRSLGRMGVWA